LREYPLDGLTGFNTKEDRRHDRRTLSLDEDEEMTGEGARARLPDARAAMPSKLLRMLADRVAR